MFERFTEKALRVILLAQEEARKTGHNFVGTEQILIGLIEEGSGIGSKALKENGLKVSEVRKEINKLIGKGSGFIAVEIPFTPRAKSILEQSLQQARAFNHSYIGTEHMLLALLDDTEGIAIQILTKLKVTEELMTLLRLYVKFLKVLNKNQQMCKQLEIVISQLKLLKISKLL